MVYNPLDPMYIATDGMVSSYPAALRGVVDGFWFFITEEIIEDSSIRPPAMVGGSFGPKRKSYRKRITVRVVILDEVYTQSIDVDDLNLSLTDVKVVVDHSDKKPTIRIVVPN